PMKAKSKGQNVRHRSGRMTAKGREIVASLTEAIEVERAGIPLKSRFTVRTVTVPDAPKTYNANSVRATRDMIGVSQPIFAHLLGVSATLVRAWEQGQRMPAPWARRLLDEVN